MQDKGQERLVPKLPKNIGWSMGTELRESHYLLSPKNAAPVQRGMVFHISLGAARCTLSLPRHSPACEARQLHGVACCVSPSVGWTAPCTSCGITGARHDVIYLFSVSCC